MKIIEQSFSIKETPYTFYRTLELIEKCARVCWKSKNKSKYIYDKKFLNKIIKKGHTSVTEHSNIVVVSKERYKFPIRVLNEMKNVIDNNYFRYLIKGDRIYISGNWRAWCEYFSKRNFHVFVDDFNMFISSFCLSNGYEIIEKTEDVPIELKRIVVDFITDRCVSHELVRHRVASFSQESQRYVSYNDEVFFIKPYFLQHEDDAVLYSIFEKSCEGIEKCYKLYGEAGMRPEHARVVLGNQVKTRIIMTAYLPDWNDIFKLRCNKSAYPQIRSLMLDVKKEFKKEWGNYVK